MTPDSFVTDNGPAGTAVSADVRAPISSTCTADPFDADGAACQGAAQGTPFFLFTEGGTEDARLLAQGYASDAPATGPADGVTQTAAHVSATVNTQGTPVGVQFEFGPTTAYGSTTALQRLGPGNDTPQAFSAVIGGLTAAKTIHYRAVAITDFGKVAGADRTLRTAALHVKLAIAKTTLRRVLAGKRVRVTVSADGPATVALSATTKVVRYRRLRTITLGRLTVQLGGGGSRTASVQLGRPARAVLRRLHRARIVLRASATTTGGATAAAQKTITIT